MGVNNLLEAVEPSFFYGRAWELATLEQWIVSQAHRLVVISGMGGIGKTALATKIVVQIQKQFEHVIWRSLLHAPPIAELLAELILLLSDEQENDLPQDVDSRISRLLAHLRSSRCLLVLDNVETILLSRNYAGDYRQGYYEYSQLFRRVGEVCHQSCLLLTSREKLRELTYLEGETLPVRSLELTGVGEAEGREIFKAKGVFTGSDTHWQVLIEHYAGNPLALKIAAAAIQELFNQDISEFLAFLQQGTIVFQDIRNLLDHQFDRLSDLEKEIMYWLAVACEPVHTLQLQADLAQPVSKSQLLTVLESLKQRSLIEKCSGGFFQQPFVTEYLIERLIEQIFQEITSEKILFLTSHALIKAQAKDYVRENQVRVVLQPLLERLRLISRSKKDIERKLNQILFKLQDESTISPRYGAGNIINLLRQLDVNFTNYDFSNLTIWQAYLQGVNLRHVNLQNCDLHQSVFTKTFSSILSIAFSPDGRLLATGDSHGEIYVWHVTDGQQLLTCKGPPGWVHSVTFSPDGHLLASSGGDYSVRLWEANTGQILRTITGHTHRVYSVAFSPDCQTLVTASADSSMRLWDANTGQCLKVYCGHADAVTSAVFSPDGRLLASGSYDHTVRLWEANTGRVLKTITGHTHRVCSLAFNPDNQTLASGSADSSVRLWDVTTGQCLKVYHGHGNWVWSIAFSTDGTLIASGSSDQTIKLWDVNTGKCLQTLQGHKLGVWSIALSPTGNILASGGGSQSVKLWETPTGKSFRTLQGYTNWIWSVAFSSDSRLVASANGDHAVRLWEVSTGKCLRSLQGHYERVFSVAFAPPLDLNSPNQLIVSGSEDRSVRLWDVNTGQCLKTLQGHTDGVWSVACSSTRCLVASGSLDQTVRLWDISTGHCLKILQGHSGRVFAIAFSPDGQLLASSSSDQTVRLWNVQTGQCLKILQHSGRVFSIAFSPDGQFLASSSEDQTVQMWSVCTGEILRSLSGCGNRVFAITFSPDGQFLAGGSEDHVVRIWSVQTAQVVRILPGHSNEVWSVVFSPDGHTLATGSQDETLKLWEVKTSKCLKTLRTPGPYEGMNITGVTGLTETAIATLKALGAVEYPFGSSIDSLQKEFSVKSPQPSKGIFGDLMVDELHQATELDAVANNVANLANTEAELTSAFTSLSTSSEKHHDLLQFENLSLSRSTREVYRGERAIELTSKEFNLLEYLMAHPYQVMSRNLLLEQVWNNKLASESNIIEVYIGYLRLKIEQNNEKRLIHTVRGLGYVLR